MKIKYIKRITTILALVAVMVIGLFFISQAKSSKYLEGIALGGEWFLNNQDENFLHYTYRPYKDTHDKEHHAMREMGAMWSIARIGNWLDDDRYRELTTKGFNYFRKSFKYIPQEKMYYVDVTPTKIKLGYNAFAILTLLELDDYPNRDIILERLANGILYQQNPNGSLRTFFYSERATGIDYYPGEALLSLMALYEYSGNERYLEAVKKAFPYYRDYWRKNKNTAFPPWQSRAYYKLYKATGDSEVRDFIYEMADYMLEQYHPKGACSEFDFTAGSVAAVHAEGVNMAYDLSRNNCYRNFSKEVADYILSLQITDTENFAISAIGGILGHEDSTSQRVDRNQHVVLMMMDAYDFGIIR